MGVFMMVLIFKNTKCRLTRIGIICRIMEILLRKPFFLLFRFRDIDAFDFENDRPRPIIAAGDHNPLIIGPAMHDRTALQGRIHIAADGIPGLPAEPTIHEMVEIILLRRPFQNESIPLFKTGTFSGIRIRQIFLLIRRKYLRFQDRDPAFVLHSGLLS